MEAFESFVALAIEAEGFVVSPAVKFDVRRRTRNGQHQLHGYEVDVVGARRNLLVLASVKSFFGSRGVVAEQVTGESRDSWSKGYALLNDPELRDSVIRAAADRYGYREGQVRLRLYVGRFAAPTKGTNEPAVRAWAASQRAGGGPIEVVSAREVVEHVLPLSRKKQYRDHPVLVALKVLEATGHIAEPG